VSNCLRYTAEKPQLYRILTTKVLVRTHSRRSVGPKLTAERCGARCDPEKRPSGWRRCVQKTTEGLEQKENDRRRARERERERGKKSQGWNGAGRRPLIKIPWHIAVCYTTTIYAFSIYTICAIHTHSLLPRLYNIHNSLVCVCVCVCARACVWRAKTHWPNLRSLSIDRHNIIL